MLSLLILAPPQVAWSTEARSTPAPKGGLVLPSGEVAVFGSRRKDDGMALVMSISGDGGKTWREIGTVATDPSPRADLGDGNAVRLKDGRLWSTYRRNHHGSSPDYAIEVAESRDGGKTWTKQATVDSSKPEGPGPSRGLWAPFLFVTAKGEAQCYYDDERMPFERGSPGHQWIAMRAWRGGRWSDPVVAAREPSGLSRDGMASVVELGKGRLLLAVEAVRADEPHSGLLRAFRSDDGGRTWSLPSTLYAPRDARFHAFAPSMVRLKDRIVCLFGTNEDRSDSPRSGTPANRMMLDIKSVESRDEGRTWSPPSLVYGGTHRNYLPSVVALSKQRLLCTFLDFDKGPLAVEGTLGK